MKLWVKYKGLAYMALLIVIAPLLVYRYAVGNTIKQWWTARKYGQEMELLHSTSGGREKQPAGVVGDTEMILSGMLVAELLPLIETEKLKIVHFLPYVTSDDDGILLTTGQLSLQGGFSGMVKLLDSMESGMPHCKVISAQFRSSRPRNRNSVKTLECTIYIQQITGNNPTK